MKYVQSDAYFLQVLDMLKQSFEIYVGLSLADLYTL